MTSATPNEPPVIERVRFRPSAPRAGDLVRAVVGASDPDGDRIRLSYQWKVDGRRVDGSASLDLDDARKGSLVEVHVVAHDGENASEVATAAVRVGNRAPVLLGVVIEPLGEVTVGHDVVASPKATDLDGDEIEYEYVWEVNGLRKGVQGAVLPKDQLRRGDQIRLTVVASDGVAESEPIRSQRFEVANAPPRITSSPGGFDREGGFRYPLVAEDPDDGRHLRYHLREGPAGMRISTGSGLVTWKPRQHQAGSHSVVLEVEDMLGAKATQSFVLQVDFGSTPSPAAAAP
jgi:hypothetical protein